MNWREFILSLEPAAEFAPPVESDALSAAGADLGTQLPAELRSLLEQSNGVLGAYGLDLVWPLERIIEDNVEFRRRPDFRDLYMPFDSLLFFADAGNGDQFAFRVLARQEAGPDVYAWNHEDDSRNWCAPNLGTYLEWWLTDRIKT